MQMMYEVIYKALMEVGLEDAFSPQDYLNFFCLGNREATEGNDSLCSESPTAENTPQVTYILKSVLDFSLMYFLTFSLGFELLF